MCGSVGAKGLFSRIHSDRFETPPVSLIRSFVGASLKKKG